jgi:hypothetical protein
MLTKQTAAPSSRRPSCCCHTCCPTLSRESSAANTSTPDSLQLFQWHEALARALGVGQQGHLAGQLAGHNPVGLTL